MQVSDLVKNEYRDNSIMKYIRLSFPELGMTITNDQIYTESLKLKESLCESKNIEFVGCIASSFKIKVSNLKQDIKGKKIEAYIYTDATSSSPIKLFSGIVDSVVRDSNKRSKEITAYDVLYSKGNIDVAGWYKSLTFPITLLNLRNSLFSYLGITQVSATLPADTISVNKQYNPESLQSITVIRSICQINGMFGIINRDGKFEYRAPIKDLENVEHFDFYRTVDFEEFEVKPVDRVIVRQNEDDSKQVAYGGGKNTYIVQGNMFTVDLGQNVKKSIAQYIHDSISGFKYIPVKSSNNGLPWIECGLDAVSYEVYNYDYDKSKPDDSEFINKTFYVLNREMSGIQALKDSYISEGDEYQVEFITDLHTQIESIKRTSQEKQSLSIKTVEYLLPASINESAIASGETHTVETFEFSNGSEGEKASFYSCINFMAETNVVEDVYSDCRVVAKLLQDDTVVKTITCDYGDGGHMMMLNYLIKDLTKGNHTFLVTLSVSNGKVDSINLVSSYILSAATTGGDYSFDGGFSTEDYDAFDDFGNWGYDVLPDGIIPEYMDEEILDNNPTKFESMIKKYMNPSPTVTDFPDVSHLSQWYLSKYILMHSQYYGEEFYKTSGGYYRKKGAVGTDKAPIQGRVGQNSVLFYIPIKRIRGYHFFKFDGRLIQYNGMPRGWESVENWHKYQAGVAAVIDGKMVTRLSPYVTCTEVTDWQTHSVGISTLPYVDYIVMFGCFGSPAYRNFKFVR